jgi:hypothetical protein
MIQFAFGNITDPKLRGIIDNTEKLIQEGRHEEVLSMMVSIVVGALMYSGTSEADLKEYLVGCVTRCYDTLPDAQDSFH